jgi:hypothetical protein
MKNLRRKKKKTTQKINLYLLCIRDKFGIVLDIVPHTNYDTLLMEGMELSKEKKATWEIYNSYGRMIDGSTK